MYFFRKILAKYSRKYCLRLLERSYPFSFLDMDKNKFSVIRNISNFSFQRLNGYNSEIENFVAVYISKYKLLHTCYIDFFKKEKREYLDNGHKAFQLAWMPQKGYNNFYSGIDAFSHFCELNVSHYNCLLDNSASETTPYFYYYKAINQCDYALVW